MELDSYKNYGSMVVKKWAFWLNCSFIFIKYSLEFQNIPHAQKYFYINSQTLFLHITLKDCIKIIIRINELLE